MYGASLVESGLSDYVVQFENLLSHHGLMGVPYGHFGDGCVLVRIDFDLDDSSGTAQSFLRAPRIRSRSSTVVRSRENHGPRQHPIDRGVRRVQRSSQRGVVDSDALAAQIGHCRADGVGAGCGP
jgi:FAD/FMN-containing dehydrogenase